MKTVGVYFNDWMSWNNHIINIAKKLSNVLGKLCYNKDIVPCRIKLIK
ncbi:MAG: hypothetical protein O7D30_10360 [Rickettsia endosymbiont of Ixodes persulcatus]|nr:hypothetical protein [Rickettsia endosymbiont of Ixodes persulcatus]